MKGSLLLGALVTFLALGLSAPARAGGPPVDLSGSSWFGSGALSGGVTGGGSAKGHVDVDIDFGPQAALSLAADEFLILLDDGFTVLPVSGTWSLDEKGRVVLVLDTTEFADALVDLLYELCLEVGGGSLCDELLSIEVAFDTVKLGVKAKSNDGIDELDLKGKIPCRLLLAGEEAKVRFSFQVRDALRD